MLPLSAPPDQHDYEAVTHGSKPFAALKFPVYRELRAIVDTGEADRRQVESQARLGEVVIASGWSERLPAGRRAAERVRGALARWLRR